MVSVDACAMVTPRPEPLAMRVPVVIRVYSIIFGVFWFGFLLLIITSEPLSEVPLAVVMVALAGVVIFRFHSQRVVANESGFLVRNFYRTWRFNWDEVDDLRLGRGKMGTPFGKVIHVLIRSGEEITIDVTARPWFLPGRVKQQRTLQQLRAWVPASR